MFFFLINIFRKLKLTEQSACDDWTHPESSFLIQQAVSLSLALVFSICWRILLSTRIQGANLAPRCIRSAALGPNLKIYQRKYVVVFS